MKKILPALALLTAMMLAAVAPLQSEEGPEKLLVSARMDSAVIWMGEQTSIKLEMIQDKGELAQLAIPSDTLTEGIEIITVTPGDTAEIKNGRIQINREVIITSFDSGFYYIPPLKYVLDKDTFASQPLSLKVAPIPVDTVSADNIKAIKDVRSPRFYLWDYIPGYIWKILFVILLVSAIIYWCYNDENKTKKKEPKKRTVPPYEKAMQALQALKEEKLWQGGQDKQYYTRLTDILREYLDGRFSINAMEMTSTEILDALRRNSETRVVERHMKEILKVADFVKFAKMRPLADDNEASMRYAMTFVEETRPQAETPPEGEAAGDKAGQSPKQ